MSESDPALASSSECTPLLPKKKTPLRKGQIAIVLLLQICEPLTSMSIYPYINELISELDVTGGDERKVGYYAGLIQSLFFVAEAFTVLHWSRLSDRIGRKPVLLIGLAGTTISMILFGLQRSFWGLVVARCLTGFLNGNIGVMKSTMGDLTDQTNRAEGFSLMPVVWSIGATLGPLLGGTFARPADQFPTVFTSKFWSDYPYFLPCVATGSFVFVSWLIALFFFEECAPVKTKKSRSSSIKPKNPPLRALLTPPVILSVSNYVALAFLDIAWNALFPLFLHTPVELGGLDLPPATIGYILGVFGAVLGVYQFFFFERMVNWLGERKMFVYGLTCFIGMFATMPLASLCAKNFGRDHPLVWVSVGLTLVSGTLMDVAFGAIFMFITSSAPSKSFLGATHGLSQSIVSVTRAIGPAMSTSLFALSIPGYHVYVGFVVLTLFIVGPGGLARRLPEEMWEEKEDIEDEEGEQFRGDAEAS